MDPDLILIIGLVLGVFSIPAILSAFSEGRAPRVAALTIIIAGGMILWAISKSPTGYAISEIPVIFVEVVARYLP